MSWRDRAISDKPPAMTPTQTQGAFPQPNQQTQPIDWKQKAIAQPKPPEPESLPEQYARTHARYASRFGEQVLGQFANLRDFLANSLGYGYEKITGKEQPEARDFLKKSIAGPIGALLPTSEELKEKSIKTTGGYTKARTPEEENYDRYIETVGAYLQPGTGEFSIIKNLGIPLAGELTRHATGLLTANEKIKEGAKLAIMLVTDIATRGNGRKHASDLYNQSEQLVKATDSVPFQTIASDLNATRQKLSTGSASASSKQKALKLIDEIEETARLNGGNLPVKDLIQYRKDINEALDDLSAFEFGSQISKTNKKNSIKNVGEVKDTVIKAIDDYGATNPAFDKLNKAANEAWAVTSKSNSIANFISKAYTKPFVSEGAKVLFASGLPLLGKAGLVAAPVLASAKGIQIMTRIFQSPTLAKYYADVVKASMQQNVGAMNSSMQKLDKALAEEEKKTPPRK